MNAPQPLPRVLAHPQALAQRAGWHASLALHVGLREQRSVPLVRRHSGPLRLLRGYRHDAAIDGVSGWEQIIVHPPGGIAAGDSLSIEATAGSGSRLLLTAPGAAKWYRGRLGAPARQLLRLSVQPGAHLEWLPMETILYDGARAEIENNLRVASDASLIAADLICLGRPAGERPFRRGLLRQCTRLWVDGRLAFIERNLLDAEQGHANTVAALGSAQAFGNMFIVPRDPAHIESLLAEAREALRPFAGEVAATALPRVLIVRWRGDRAEHGWQALRAVWRALRMKINGQQPEPPRIWAC
ncbi:MAG: urease accessory protein UreD [Burkholderiaceae bacterium]